MALPQASETRGKTTNLFHKCYLFPYYLEVILSFAQKIKLPGQVYWIKKEAVRLPFNILTFFKRFVNYRVCPCTHI